MPMRPSFVSFPIPIVLTVCDTTSPQSLACSMSIANFGDYLCNPDGTAIKGMCDKAFDYSVNTYLFLYKNESFDITYTFHNNSYSHSLPLLIHRRRWVNSYSIASASYDTYGNPVSWTLYGTNVNEENLEVPYNPQQWTPLDIKIDDHVWANGQYKQYPLFSNTQPFNKYWLHVCIDPSLPFIL